MLAYTTPKKGAAKALLHSSLRWKDVNKEGARRAAGAAFYDDLRLQLAGINTLSPLYD